MKTPLNQLIEYLDEMSKLNNVMHTGLIAAKTKAKLLLEEEKQMVIDTFNEAQARNIMGKLINGEQYFKETFK
jgi:hypothetical protein